MKRFIQHGLRIFKRERFFASINLLSLTLGMFCFLVTALFVRDELRHDQWHANGENIYRTRIEFSRGNGAIFNLFPSFRILEGLKEESPGLIDAVNISFVETHEFRLNERSDWFETTRFYYSQPSLFKMFDFSLKLGDESTALVGNDKVVISNELAATHFGNENPIGQFIEIKDVGTKQVSGVLNTIPRNSHLRFEMLLAVDPKADRYAGRMDDWVTGPGLNYFLIREDYSAEKLKADVGRLLEKHEASEYADGYQFERFSDLYMGSMLMRSDGDNMFGGQVKYIYIFSIIGVLMLIVACFNYINLTTARSFSRSQEIGIRKVIGASKTRLVLSQMAETLFISCLSMVLAVICMELMGDSISNLIGKDLTLDLVNDPSVILLPLILLLLVSIVSGIYPALTTSRFNLASVLKGDMPRSNVSLLRKALVVLQFFICAGLLSGALIIRGQANYLINKDMGYNEKNVVNIDLSNRHEIPKYAELRAELEKIPLIEKVSGSPLPNINSVMFIDENENGEKIFLTPFFGSADKDFNELFELKILEGTDFSELSDSDLKTAVLVNETAVEKLGWKDPVGKKLTDNMIVVGVVQDFLYRSAKNSIDPAVIQYDPDNVRYLQFRFRNGNKAEVLAQVEEVWNSFGTEVPFDYSEVEAFFAGSYQKEQRLVRIFDVLTVFLISVAFLGLFALSVFESQLREKEVSIRKVLGASYYSLIGLLNRRFMILIFIALICSVPVSYLMLDQWLQDFPYHISSMAPYFAVASTGIILLALIMLSVHSFVNSRKNPVNILRNQ